MGLSDNFWGYYLKEKLGEIVSKSGAIVSKYNIKRPALPDDVPPIRFTSEENTPPLFPPITQTPLPFQQQTQQDLPPAAPQRIEEDSSYDPVPARDDDLASIDQIDTATADAPDEDSFVTMTFKDKMQRTLNTKMNELQRRLYLRLGILPVPLLNLPTGLSYDQIMTVNRGIFCDDEYTYGSFVLFTYQPDFEGYKGGRVHYFHIYTYMGVNIAIYQNGRLSYDPAHEKKIWLFIQQMESKFAGPDFILDPSSEWRKHPRSTMAGKPACLHYGWYRIPGHWKSVYAHSPDFKAPYDDQPVSSPSPGQHTPLPPLPETMPPVAPERPEPPPAFEPDDDGDLGRDQY